MGEVIADAFDPENDPTNGTALLDAEIAEANRQYHRLVALADGGDKIAALVVARMTAMEKEVLEKWTDSILWGPGGQHG